MSKTESIIRLVIADDHTLFRQGLSVLIRSRTIYDVVGEASDGAEAWELVVEHEPDVAIVDLSMPKLKGTELIRRASQSRLRTQFLLLTMHTHDALVVEASRAGAAGCLVKDDAFEDLETAIEEVLAGAFFTSRSLTPPADGAVAVLSPREKEILMAIIRGLTNKELADTFQISVKTIETHRLRLMKKIGAHNTADIVRIGIEMGL